MGSGKGQKDRQGGGTATAERETSGDERRSSVITAAEQERMEKEYLTKAREASELAAAGAEENSEKLATLQEAIEGMPGAIERAMSAAMATAMQRASEDPRTKAAATEIAEDAATKVVEEKVDGNVVVRSAKWLGHSLKPRAPRQEDVFPVVASNAISWGGAYVLSQVSGGVSDFLVDLFSQTGDAGAA